MTQGIYGCLGCVTDESLDRARSKLLHRGCWEYTVSREPNIRLVNRTSTPAAALPDIPLVYCGLITNRDELAASLGKDGMEQSEEGTRQLLWDLYRTFGTDAFERISGTFAIALADAERASLLLAVDRWAARPLYFSDFGSGWMFASEAKALLSARPTRDELNPDVAGFLAATKYLPPRLTLANSVHVVGPGQYVRIHLGGAEVGSYPALKLQIDPHSDERTVAARLRECVLDATRRIVKDYDRIGIALSGGLDSVLTLGAVRLVASHKPIYTYTVAYDRNNPVLAKARDAAKYFGSVHREIVIDAEELEHLLPEMVWRMEDPVAREEMLVYHVLSKHAAREVPIVLYGHMADMLFGGMPRHMLINLASELRFARSTLMQFYDYTQSGKRPGGLLAQLLVVAHTRGRRLGPPRTVTQRAPIEPKSAPLTSPDPLNAALLSALAYPSEISAIEKLHAWAGVELASIFHDRAVAACAFRIPGRLKIRGRRRKHILRVAARGILPDGFAQRPKDLIRIKRDEQLMRVVRRLSAELLSPASLIGRDIFNPSDLRRICQAATEERCTDEAFYHLWTLLLIEIWCREFLDDPARARTMTPPVDSAHVPVGGRPAFDVHAP